MQNLPSHVSRLRSIVVGLASVDAGVRGLRRPLRAIVGPLPDRVGRLRAGADTGQRRGVGVAGPRRASRGRRASRAAPNPQPSAASDVRATRTQAETMRSTVGPPG